MQRRLAALAALLILGTVLATHPDGASQPPVTGTLTISPSDVDLFDHQGTDIFFLIHVNDDTGTQAVSVYLSKPGEEIISVDLDPAGGASLGCTDCDWSGTLEVDTPQLIAGEWMALTLATDGDGHTTAAEEIPLTVGLAEPGEHPLTVTVLGHPADDDGVIARFNMTKTDTFQVLPQIIGGEALLRNVTWRLEHEDSTYDVSPERLLFSPYTFSQTQFEDGDQSVFVFARDRAGRTVEQEIPFTVDTTPPLVAANIRGKVASPSSDRPVTYVGVPFTLDVAAADHTLHQIVINLDGQKQSNNSTLKGELHSFALERRVEGNGSILITATDALGNRFDTRFNLTTIFPITTAAPLIAVDTQWPLRGDNITFQVTASQVGVRDLPATLSLSGELSGTHAVVLPETGNIALPDTVKNFPPGRYEANAFLEPDIEVTRTGGSPWHNVSFEVFTGAVKFKNDTYYIQVDDAGFPCRATKAKPVGSPLSCNVFLRETNDGDVYAFTLDNRDLYWNPATKDADGRPITDLTPKKESILEKATPAPWLPLVALALLGAALRRR